MTSLTYIHLAKNQFTGRMPGDFGRLKNLTHLNLSDNDLLQVDMNLTISSLANCTQLRQLSIATNLVDHHQGILPKSFANLSTTLTELYIANLTIRGPFPTAITKFVNLVWLDMSNNKLTGSLPHDLGKLHKLQTIYLSSNELTGTLPGSLWNLSYLTGLFMRDNELEGNIPGTLGSCPSLLRLQLDANKLVGTVPSELLQGSAKFLDLSMAANQLKGSIPPSISNQMNLNYIRLSNNDFTGPIPAELGGCTELLSLYLDGNSFNGSIPSSLSSLAGLEEMDLSRNNLSGAIPSYLSRFRSITYLNLSYNHFEGSVPIGGVFENESAVSLVGNTKLCGGVLELHLPKCIDENPKNKERIIMSHVVVKVIVPTIVSLVGVVTLAIALYYLSCVKNKGGPSILSGLVMGSQFFYKVSYAMLLEATDGFSSENLLGVGSFGSVFKGNLDGKMVAVKVLDLRQRGASNSFMAECVTLRNARHRNLVGVITICSSIDFQANEFKALVYEFIPNGSVDTWLHHLARNLTLSQRLDIAIDVALALSYLHHGNKTPIVHCDLKPSNVLLDNDMVAHVGDFGLAKFLNQPVYQNQSSSIGIRGTVGYVAPEYGLGSEPSPDGDLYSFGILLLELVTRKRPTDSMFKEDYTLHMYAEAALPEKVLQIADPSLEYDEINEENDDRRAIQKTIQQRLECVASMVSVGVACSHHMPQDRMRITDAICKLQAAREKLLSARRMRQFYG